jgi:hypothetical protein
MHHLEAQALPRVVETSQLMMAKREMSMVPYHIGVGALEHLGEHHSFLCKAARFSWIQLAQRPSGLKQEVQMRRHAPATLGPR